MCFAAVRAGNSHRCTVKGWRGCLVGVAQSARRTKLYMYALLLYRMLDTCMCTCRLRSCIRLRPVKQVGQAGESVPHGIVPCFLLIWSASTVHADPHRANNRDGGQREVGRGSACGGLYRPVHAITSGGSSHAAAVMAAALCVLPPPPLKEKWRRGVQTAPTPAPGLLGLLGRPGGAPCYSCSRLPQANWVDVNAVEVAWCKVFCQLPKPVCTY
jgi:hypothetical protein